MAMDTIARGLAASVKKNLAENYYDKDQVDYLVDQIPKFSIEVVDELPTEDISPTTIYMLRSEETGSDLYQEWIYVDGEWEMLGVQESAFDNYYTKEETNELLENITTQYEIMPTASSENLGQIVQYIGIDTQDYTNGYFYKCISDGETPATYSWEQVSVQDEYELPIAGANTLGGIKVGSGLNIDINGLLNSNLPITILENNITYPESPSSYDSMASSSIRNNGVYLIKNIASNYIQMGGEYPAIIFAYKDTFSFMNLKLFILSPSASNTLTAFATRVQSYNGSVINSNSFANTYARLSFVQTNTSRTLDYFNDHEIFVFDHYRKYIGNKDKSQLQTTNKSSLVEAINEVNTKAINASIQYSTMPTASASNVGQIVQYTGATSQNYTNGYFYICVSDGGDPATYSWSQLNIQPAPDMSNYYTKAEVYNKEETDEMIDGIEELIGDVNTILATLTTLPSMSTIAERLEEVVDVTETPANNGGE